MASRARRLAVAAVAMAGIVGAAAAPSLASTGTTPRTCAQPAGRVTSIAISGTTAFLGGSFTSVKRPNGSLVARSRLAAVDTVTCDVLPWSASADADVLALRVVGDTLYLGGSFTAVNGSTRNRLAAVSTSTGALQSFAPSANSTVRALAAAGGMLYAGGDFTAIGSVTRKKLAAFAVPSGALSSSWRPVARGRVQALAVSPDAGSVYVGGSFSTLAGESAARYLGAVDASTGAIDRSFLPRPSFPMITLAADSRGVYAGGGGSGGHLAVYRPDGSRWHDYQTDGGVQALAVDGDLLYVGGHFGNYCIGGTGSGSPYLCTNPLERRKAFAVALSTGALTSWAPELNSAHGVFALTLDPLSGDVWAGGDFTTVDGAAVSRLAVFP